MKKTFFLLIGVLLCSHTSFSQIRLPNVIADDMVLQQQAQVQLWGKSTPGKTVVITTGWNNVSYKVKVGADSLFRVKVSTPKASFEPYTITFRQKEKITLRNILIGEVWLCAGQSNMEQLMKGFYNQPTTGSLKDILHSQDNALRVYTVQKKSSVQTLYDVTGTWASAHPNRTGEFTATGYYFGRLLRQMLGVPVGLIHASWGGSRIEPWIPKEYFFAYPEKKLPLSESDNAFKNREPTVLYNGMLSPVQGFGIKGAIWYQGESNINQYEEYPGLFATMHKAWQEKWDVTFPIYFCQIAPYQYKVEDKQYAALMREKQLEISLTQSNTGMAVLMDAGVRGCIHPGDKKTAGERLAYIALAKNYGFKSLPYTGGTYDGVAFEQDKALISFKNTEERGFDGVVPLIGFELAGSDKVFYPAKAKVIRKDNRFFVEAVSSQVSAPVAVRYCFKDWAEGTLFSVSGLPITSFRSDNWDDIK